VTWEELQRGTHYNVFNVEDDVGPVFAFTGWFSVLTQLRGGVVGIVFRLDKADPEDIGSATYQPETGPQMTTVFNYGIMDMADEKGTYEVIRGYPVGKPSAEKYVLMDGTVWFCPVAVGARRKRSATRGRSRRRKATRRR
jgi:hypothetical protein